MKPYNINRIIVLPILEKIKYQINKEKCELNSQSIIIKYEYSS